MNHFSISASLIERSVLRYTPAGIAISEMKLHYQGKVTEAQQSREVQFEVDTVSAGEIAVQVQSLNLGQVYEWQGFMAPSRKGSYKLRFHATQFS